MILIGVIGIGSIDLVINSLIKGEHIKPPETWEYKYSNSPHQIMSVAFISC